MLSAGVNLEATWSLLEAYVPVIGLGLAVAEIACDWPETGRGRDCL